MKVGFCTSVTNRRWQLERTLALNLGKLRGTGSFLAVCDFGSSDDVAGFVKAGFADDLRSGTLSFFRTSEPTGFHASKAKNLAHRLALLRRPDALFNLDCDNYLAEGTLALVQATLSDEPEACLHEWTCAPDDGTCGRIGLRAATWAALGGYDERFGPTAFQDLDLLMRCRAAGLRYRLQREGIPRPVQNSLPMKVAALEGDAGPSLSDAEARARYQHLYIDNLVTSLARPVRLSLAEQQRWRGTLDFATAIEI
ncbi:MAG TPA: hypothetical protein VGF45_20200 [Polyangia bacterium]